MVTHVKVIAAIYLVFGALGLVGALFSSVLFGVLATVAGTSGNPDGPIGGAVLGLTGAALTSILLAFAIPSIVCAWGLWTFRNWARILGIVLAIVGLVHFPLGTIFGVYALFILFQRDTETLFVRPHPAA